MNDGKKTRITCHTVHGSELMAHLVEEMRQADELPNSAKAVIGANEAILAC